MRGIRAGTPQRSLNEREHMANDRLSHAFEWLEKEILSLRNPDLQCAPAPRVHSGFEAIEEALKVLAMEVRDLKEHQQGKLPS